MHECEMTTVIRGSYYYGSDNLIQNKTIRIGIPVNIAHNPNNRFDSNACEVKLESGKLIGHLPSALARTFWTVVSSNNVTSAKIVSIADGKIKIRVAFLGQEGHVTRAISNKDGIAELHEDISEKQDVAGVYRIINSLNGKYYIGSSSNIRTRFGQHLKMLSSGNHHNHLLQDDFDIYGAAYFSFEILKECSSYQTWESSYIKDASRKDKSLLYNLTKDGGGRKAYSNHAHITTVPGQLTVTPTSTPQTQLTQTPIQTNDLKVSAALKPEPRNSSHVLLWIIVGGIILLMLL